MVERRSAMLGGVLGRPSLSAADAFRYFACAGAVRTGFAIGAACSTAFGAKIFASAWGAWRSLVSRLRWFVAARLRRHFEYDDGRLTMKWAAGMIGRGMPDRDRVARWKGQLERVI